MKNALVGLLAILQVGAFSAHASIITVREISATADPDAWVVSAQAGDGVTGLIDLTPLGGALDSGQPGGAAPGGTNPGVAFLSTGSSNADRAELGTFQDFGLASSVFADVDLSYNFYKEPGAAPAPAPSLKLDVFNPSAVGDGYGQLIFEPYWQGSNPAEGSWVSVAIDENTGAGGTGSGGWWWSGGFGEPSGGGGPPIRSLAEWDALFATSAASDYSGAHVTGIRVGLGTFNPDQLGYFDDVSFTSGAFDVTYSFAVPEPSTYFSIGLIMAVSCLFIWRRRRQGVEPEADAS